VVRGVTVIARELPFELEFYELDDSSSFEIDDLYIKAIPVEHRTVCYAYSVEVKRLGKFDVLKARELNLPNKYWSLLQNGEGVYYEGKTYLPQMVMGKERKGLKLTYSTDTRPIAGLIDFAENSDLYICEGIYGDDEKLCKALEYKHMTFSEAANLAKSACVKEMWLTHYSPSMTNPEDYIEKTREIFPNTKLGYDRKTCTLAFED
jgi:ribonuclease Z